MLLELLLSPLESGPNTRFRQQVGGAEDDEQVVEIDTADQGDGHCSGLMKFT